MQGYPGVGDGGNFGFLTGHDPVFVELAAGAERAFSHDPNTTLIKLRQFGEAMAKALPHFHSPDGLLDRLKRSRAAAEQRLRDEGFGYLRLRDYQENARGHGRRGGDPRAGRHGAGHGAPAVHGRRPAAGGHL